jgi:hypothetical protein
MPPPEGYRVERGGQDAGNERIESALATLELVGHPTQAEIKTQFRQLALRYHPDRNPGDAAAQERMKEIIAAYKMVSEDDVLAALEGLGDREYYYKILHETEIEITGTGLSMKLTIAMSGPGDWIYASHMAPHAERIYLGCYSGMVYCVDPGGNVLKVYSTDAPIDGILERRRYLYVWTHTSLYVLEDDKVANHIDLREGGLERVTVWGLIVRKGTSLMLCSESGTGRHFPAARDPPSMVETCEHPRSVPMFCHVRRIPMDALNVEMSIAEGKQALQALLEFAREEAGTLETHEAEKGIFKRLLPMGLAAMKLYFAQRGTGDVGPAVTRADGMILPREQKLRGRDYCSRFGKFAVARTCYRRPGEPGIFPLDARSTSPSGATRTSCRSGWPCSRASTPSRTVQAGSSSSLTSILPRAS